MDTYNNDQDDHGAELHNLQVGYATLLFLFRQCETDLLQLTFLYCELIVLTHKQPHRLLVPADCGIRL